jgi:hypothetical protein
LRCSCAHCVVLNRRALLTWNHRVRLHVDGFSEWRCAAGTEHTRSCSGSSHAAAGRKRFEYRPGRPQSQPALRLRPHATGVRRARQCHRRTALQCRHPFCHRDCANVSIHTCASAYEENISRGRRLSFDLALILDLFALIRTKTGQCSSDGIRSTDVQKGQRLAERERKVSPPETTGDRPMACWLDLEPRCRSHPAPDIAGRFRWIRTSTESSGKSAPQPIRR